MTMTHDERQRLERLEPAELAAHQLARLNELLAEILPHNQFYAAKLRGRRLPLASLDELAELPLTSKEELVQSGYETAANLTYPVDRYVRFHRTSGTRGRPLVVLDTAADWQWWLDAWQFVLDAAEVTSHDRALMAFSFGPFIGFWSAHDALAQRGTMVIPAGGMSTEARLELARTCGATVVLCTPTYAMHMAHVAEESQIDVGKLGVRRIIVAGEPGGSVPAIRRRIEVAWNAKVIDHTGATEVGPWGYANGEQTGVYVNESQFIAEFLSRETGQPAADGELSELVLTTLGRAGSPVLRYRTGDLVRPTWNSPGEPRFVLLQGGVLSRTDDMLIIRGVNVFPSSVEQILRSFPEVVEYRITARKRGAMDTLAIEVEDRLNEPDRIEREFQLRLGLKIDLALVPLGSLPRSEGKGRHFVDERT
jgi:phenylacetate-CoA ligase